MFFPGFQNGPEKPTFRGSASGCSGLSWCPGVMSGDVRFEKQQTLKTLVSHEKNLTFHVYWLFDKDP